MKFKRKGFYFLPKNQWRESGLICVEKIVRLWPKLREIDNIDIVVSRKKRVGANWRQLRCGWMGHVWWRSKFFAALMPTAALVLFKQLGVNWALRRTPLTFWVKAEKA